MSSLLEGVQEWLAGHLSTRGSIRGVNVLTRKQGKLRSRIDEALKKHGGCIVILPPNATVRGEVQGPLLEKIEIPVLCYEQPERNKSGKSALAMGEAVLIAAHLQTPPVKGVTSPILADQNALQPVDEESNENVIQVNLFLSGALQSAANSQT